MSKDIDPPGGQDLNGQADLPAGCFSSWLRRIRYVLLKEDGVTVNCGECNACCSSGYFIHIRPEETKTLARIPKQLLFPAPGLPKGNVLLGHDQDGCCPMLVDHQCSIYEDRPRTCRNYDCRIFAAAGIGAGIEDQARITQRSRRWKFSYPTKHDDDLHQAVQAAAKFMREHAECFPGGVPSNASQLAIVALKVYGVFLTTNGEFIKAGSQASNIEIAKAIMAANEQFEMKREQFQVRPLG